MNNTTKYILAVGSLVSLSSVAQAEFEISGGYHSSYEFRGFDYGDDLREVGIDYTKELGNGFTFDIGAWTGRVNDESTDISLGANSVFQGFFSEREEGAIFTTGGVKEFDISVGVSKSIGVFDVRLGYLYRDLTIEGNRLSTGERIGGFSTSEFSLGVNVDLAQNLELSAEYSYDIDAYEAGYLDVNLTQSFYITPNFQIALTAGAAWSFDYNLDFRTDEPINEFNHYYIAVEAPWHVGSGFVVTPYLKYIGAGSDTQTTLDVSVSEINNTVVFNDINDFNDDYLLGGITLSYKF